jgi:hypothetical protein
MLFSLGDRLSRRAAPVFLARPVMGSFDGGMVSRLRAAQAR